MTSNWSSVPELGGTLSINTLSPIISALSARTDTLKWMIDSLSGSYGVLFTDIGFHSSVKLGTIIAWDGQQYIPAQASYSAIVRPDGSLAPSDSSYIVGVVVSNIDAEGRATVLVSGWIRDKALIGALTNDSTDSGAYYLSGSGKAKPGKSTDFEIPVYCFTKTSTDILFFNPKAPEYTGHSHGKYLLKSKDWVAVESSEVPPELRSSGTSFFRYTIPVGGALHNLVSAGVTNSVLVKNGTVVAGNDWMFNTEYNTIYAAFSINPADELILYTISPLGGKDPIVHSISAADGLDILKIDDANGNIILDLDLPETQGERTGTAITAISKTTGVSTCPVVHSVQAGVGITITDGVDIGGSTIPGTKVINSSSVCANQLDLTVINLNGVLFGTEPDMLSFKFPAGVESSLYGMFRIPHFEAGAFRAKVTILLQGTGGAIPGGTLTVKPISFPKDGVAPKSVAAQYTVPAVKTTALENYYTTTVMIPAEVVTSDALLHCVLSYTKPTAAVSVVSVSLQLV